VGHRENARAKTMCGTEKTPSVKVAGDPHGTAKTIFFSYVGSESVK